MKRTDFALCLTFALVFSFASCGDKKEAPRAAARELPPSAQLAGNAKNLAGLALETDALIAAVTPDKQRTAMITIKENMEKAALVCMYESRISDGAAVSVAKAAEKKSPRKSVTAMTSFEALARFSADTEKALADVYNRDAKKLAEQALGLAADSAELLKTGAGLAQEAKAQAAPAKTGAAEKPAPH